MTALLDIEKLDVFYGVSQVLHGVDFSIARGEQVALVGRNGMGKTSFIRAVMGLAAQRRGLIAFEGVDLSAAAPETIALAGIALVPEGRGIFGSLTVIENLVMAARAGRNGSRGWTLERVLDLFPRLAERRNNGGHQLSGGEQQMLAIGRALMTNPDLLLIDEATEGLAPLVAKTIWSTLEKMRGEGVATLVVDKDLRSLATFVDRVAVMSKGQIAFSGAPHALLGEPEMLERYLGV